jgi:predicted nucleic acid-binding protein
VIIADTNVVSEFMKDEADPAVLAWAESLESTDLTICVVSVEEIERGLGRLPTGKRRRDLEQRWHVLVDAFSDAIAVYDVAAARATAKILVDAEAGGHPMALADAQIAGICVAGAYRLATRNQRDFEHVTALSIVNPFV